MNAVVATDLATGRVNSALNSSVFARAFVVQWAMGATIKAVAGAAAGYDPRGYRLGLGVAPLIALGAWVGC